MSKLLLAKRLGREDKGFTLIELMVVVLIIAILIAIAIPTFLGARKRAQDRAAQSSLRNAVSNATTVFTDRERYNEATVTALTEAEPSLTFQTTDSAAPTEVSIGSSEVGGGATGNHNRFYAATWSKSGKCFYVQDIKGPSGITNAGTTWTSVDDVDANDCAAADAGAVAYNAAAWSRQP